LDYAQIEELGENLLPVLLSKFITTIPGVALSDPTPY
jgi:hypothetical protein